MDQPNKSIEINLIVSDDVSTSNRLYIHLDVPKGTNKENTNSLRTLFKLALPEIPFGDMSTAQKAIVPTNTFDYLFPKNDSLSFRNDGVFYFDKDGMQPSYQYGYKCYTKTLEVDKKRLVLLAKKQLLSSIVTKNFFVRNSKCIKVAVTFAVIAMIVATLYFTLLPAPGLPVIFLNILVGLSIGIGAFAIIGLLALVRFYSFFQKLYQPLKEHMKNVPEIAFNISQTSLEIDTSILEEHLGKAPLEDFSKASSSFSRWGLTLMSKEDAEAMDHITKIQNF